MNSTQTQEQSDFSLTIERVFDAPRSRLWEAWTDKAQLAQWFAPKGLQVKDFNGNIAVGENYRECMVNPDGDEHVLFGEYLEINPQEKIVFTHSWETGECDSSEAEIPARVRTVCTVLFEEIDGNKTKLTFTQTGLTSQKSRDSHHGGWQATLDSLVDYMQ